MDERAISKALKIIEEKIRPIERHLGIDELLEISESAMASKISMALFANWLFLIRCHIQFVLGGHSSRCSLASMPSIALVAYGCI